MIDYKYMYMLPYISNIYVNLDDAAPANNDRSSLSTVECSGLIHRAPRKERKKEEKLSTSVDI